MAPAHSSIPTAFRHSGALSRCQSLLEEITHFLAEEARCTVAQTNPDEAVQRAKAMVESLTQAVYDLDLEIPVGQHNLWLDEQCKKYHAALQDLLKFMWSKV